MPKTIKLKKLKRETQIKSFSSEKFWFIDDIKESLIRINFSKPVQTLVLKYTNFKYHSEIYDLIITKNEKEKSLLKLFKKFSIIIIPENNKIHLFITSKYKTDSGYNNISGYLLEFKTFLEKNVSFIQGTYDDIEFHD